jgi:hypothetical protein
MFDRKVHPMLHDLVFRRAAEEGIAYRNNQNVLAADEAFQLVADNVGVAFLTMASALRTKMRYALSSIKSFVWSFTWHPAPTTDPNLRVNLCARS